MHSLVRNAVMAIGKSNSQTALDRNYFISKINDLYAAREHRTWCTILKSVSHHYLQNTIYYIVSACNNICLEEYQITLAFYSKFCEPKKIRKTCCKFHYIICPQNAGKFLILIVFWIVKVWSHICFYKPKNSRYLYHTIMGLPLGRVFSTTIKYSPHFQWTRMVICLLVTVKIIS